MLLLPPLWFAVLAFVDLTPAVLSLPLLLVTTAVLDGTEFPFVLGLIFEFVSTTPFLVALLLPELLFPEFELSAPHPAPRLAATSKQSKAKVRRIKFSSCEGVV
jgi:hypothetical protein